MSEFIVRPFAFMRLTHEGLRDGFTRLREAASAGVDEAREAFAALSPVIALHAAQEEQVFFPLLDERFDEVVRKAGLREAHAREHALQGALEDALARGDLDATRAAVEAWTSSFEAHLRDEEEVMMPLTEKLEGRAGHVRRILEVDWAALKRDHLPYVTRSLARTKPYGVVRTFVSAVQASAGDGWAELEPIVRAGLLDPQVAQLTEDGHLSRPS
jgi:hemerythrin-like domain-containing protein